MSELLRRIGRDLRRRRNVDAYVVALFALVFAVFSLVGDRLPEDLRWAVLLAGVGLLVYRVTVPEGRSTTADGLLRDRTDFEGRPLAARLRGARELWVLAPSAVNVLTTPQLDVLRAEVLARPEGAVRVIVLDPARREALRVASRQLDDGLDFPEQTLEPSLRSSVEQLERMRSWQVAGSFEYRLLDFSPGFSLVAIDPSSRHGTVVVEFHGFHNESTGSRMHVELTRADSEQWYAYWIDQFDHAWQRARPPGRRR